MLQAEVRDGNFHVYKTRAQNVVQRLLNCTDVQARQYVRVAVLSLGPGDYAYTLEMLNGQMQDVYGKVIGADGWYLKLEINMNDGQAGIVSSPNSVADPL